MLNTKEFYDLVAQFDKDFFGIRLDKEEKSLWSMGSVYQNGEANSLFNAYQKGYSFSKLINR